MKYSCYQMNSNYDFPLHFHFFCEFCPVAGKAGYFCLSGIKKIIKGGINSIPIIIILTADTCLHMNCMVKYTFPAVIMVDNT